ncbi:MAG TPA: hypothetical protein VKA84_27930 [Gemmatimonadaceae bacterium]|nr:hypothetical protein [Gemmatimonadaceae bacterium]
MRFTITHAGVPVGTVDLAPGPTDGRAAGLVTRLPAYTALSPLVGAASAALWQLAAAGPLPVPVEWGGHGLPNAGGAAGGALGDATALGRALELRDERGELVATDYVELIELRDRSEGGGVSEPGPVVVALVGLRHAPAAILAREPPRRSAGGDAARPEA